MKLLSGPSEAQRTKKGSFTQSHRPIVVTGRQSAAGPQFVPQDPERDLDRRTRSSDTGGSAPPNCSRSLRRGKH